MSSVLKRRSRANPSGRKPALGRDAWLNAARDALIREGVGAVQIGRLARSLGVTRGGFYWFFDSRRQLLKELAADWEHTNTAAFKQVLQDSGHNGVAEFQAITDIWVNERSYSPAWDSAMRDWARTAKAIANAVRRVDDERIEILKQIFLDMGYDEDEAFVRARIVYFHQIGYYTLDVQESRQQRLRLLPLYVRILTGQAS